MKKLLFILIMVALLASMSISLVSAQETGITITNETGSISGKVIPAEAGIKVRAIQNLSLVAETTTDEEGNYKISDLKPGKYGLLFISPNAVYVYNDEINSNWGRREENKIIINLKETISQNASDININLNNEWPDYALGRITVQFKSNVSEDKIGEIISLYNCSIKEKNEQSYGIYYTINIPEDKTVLEITRDFNLNENIEFAEPEGIARAGVQEGEKNITEVSDNQTESELEVEEEPKSWFSKFIQFLKSLFGLK